MIQSSPFYSPRPTACGPIDATSRYCSSHTAGAELARCLASCSWLTAVLLMVGTMTRERLVAATLVHCLLLIADATLDELTGQGDGNGRPAHSFSTAECSLARLPTSPGPSRAPITGWCKTMNLDTRVHKETCNHLPSFAPSPTCGALDLADSAAWMPTEPRTLWLWGDSVMVQLWDHLLCFLSNHVSPGSPEGPPGGDYPRKPVR